jgi:hypothetical protein
MPTPNGVNSYFSACNILDNFADFQEQESKSGCANPICPFFIYYILQPIGISVLKG